MSALVVRGNSYINEFRRRVGITESHNRDIDVRSFFDGLCVGAGVGDNDEARLFEGAGNVVGEVARGETTSNGDCSGVGCKLEDSALAVGAGRDDGDVSRIVYCGDDASSKDNFLPIVLNSEH